MGTRDLVANPASWFPGQYFLHYFVLVKEVRESRGLNVSKKHLQT